MTTFASIPRSILVVGEVGALGDFLAAHWAFLAMASFVICGVTFSMVGFFIHEHIFIACECGDKTPLQWSIRIGAAAGALVGVMLFAAAYVGVDLRGDAWAETAEVVSEKAVEKYGDVFADDQFDVESVRHGHLSMAQTWRIADATRLCAAEVVADWADPENADVIVVCGGTELPRVDR